MISRRTMLTTVAATGATMFAGNLTGLRAWAQSYVPVRKSLSANDVGPDVEAYRDFVGIMKGKEGDGSNVDWVTWANIHGTFAGGFNLCPHSNWYFLPWHRSYVQMYEQGVRELTGHKDFAMPYWDWTADPNFPAAFGDPTVGGQPNNLFVPGRAISGPIPTSVSGKTQVMDPIFAQTNYELFGSSRPAGQNTTDPNWVKSNAGVQAPLEANPHNNVHCIVRGPFMCAAPSPQDPVFFMHHGNIDRIWAVWNSLGRQNSADPLWRDMVFGNNWIDPTGAPYSSTVKDLFDTEKLGYTYGLGAPAMMQSDPGRDMLVASVFDGSSSMMSLAAGTNLRSITVTNASATPSAPLNVTIDTASQNLTGALNTTMSMAMVDAGFAEKQVYAIVRGLNATNSETTRLAVFVNQPDANASTDTDANPHYVGAVGFFGTMTMADGSTHTRDTLLNLTTALRALSDQGMLTTDAVSVQLVPLGQGGDAAPDDVAVSSVEVVVL